MLGSTDLFSSSVGHGLINLPLADVRNQRYPAILRDVPPTLRDAAIPHHCPATSAAHRARLVLTSTRVIGRNAQIAVIGSVTLSYDEREVSASRELSETTLQSSLGMFDSLMARVPKRIWTHTPFGVHPFAKIPL